VSPIARARFNRNATAPLCLANHPGLLAPGRRAFLREIERSLSLSLSISLSTNESSALRHRAFLIALEARERGGYSRRFHSHRRENNDSPYEPASAYSM